MLGMISELLGYIMPAVLLTAGLYLGVGLRFFYILHPVRTLRMMFRRGSGGISPFRAASMALAGTLGVGNITGVTAAIAMGGAGAVFWMWCSALVAMSVKYAETVLAVIYRRKNKNGYYGGAPYYISDGLSKYKNSYKLGVFFAVLCVINSFTVGNILQVNAAASAAEYSVGMPRLICGVIIAAMTAISVIGGAKRISAITSKLIPFVSFIYIAMCAVIVFGNIELLPTVTENIFKEAFSFQAAAGGIGGYGIMTAVRYGVTRGILTNEAGSGTSPTAHACADAVSPMAQGCLGIFEVFADTIVICSMTAFAVLIGAEHGLELTGDAMETAAGIFEYFIGNSAPCILTFSVFVFVFATLISQYYYGKVALGFLGIGKTGKALYFLLFSASAVLGCVIAPKLMWELSDITVGVMTTVNVISVFLLRQKVIDSTEVTVLTAPNDTHCGNSFLFRGIFAYKRKERQNVVIEEQRFK